MDATSDLQKFIEYLEKIGVGHLAKDATELAQSKQLNTIVADAWNVIAQFNDDMDDEFLTKLYKYEIPLLSEDGTCSKHGLKEEKPFDLSVVYGLKWKKLAGHQLTFRLMTLNYVAERLYKEYKLDWVGFYRKMDYKDDQKALYKEAYRGEISRPVFPLTEDFAQISNNSTVGMTGKAIVIQDVAKHAGPYYECSTKVQSEICAPIFYSLTDGSIAGIIDAESWQADFFDAKMQIQILKVCSDLTQINFIIEV
jgi:putative methionine-R-sulfoxide reductase with GAF domain